MVASLTPTEQKPQQKLGLIPLRGFLAGGEGHV